MVRFVTVVRDSIPEASKQLWAPPILVLSGYRLLFAGKSGQDVKLSSYLSLVPRLEMRGIIPPHLMLHVFHRNKDPEAQMTVFNIP